MTNALTLHMTVEVMGCPTVCQHCWAMGRGYRAMPLEDITWVLPVSAAIRPCDSSMGMKAAFLLGGRGTREPLATSGSRINKKNTSL